MVYSLISFVTLNFVIVGGLLVVKTSWNKFKSQL